MATLTFPQLVAIDTLILADVALSGILQGEKTYARRAKAPPPAPGATTVVPVPRPIIVYGNMSEDDGGSTFGKPGKLVVVTLHIWSNKAGYEEATTIYSHLERLLHEKSILIPGWRFMTGTLRLVTLLDDPNGVDLHGVAEYTPTASIAA